MVKKRSELIEVDVEFPEELSRTGLFKVVSDVLKTLLHQRHQIPLQYDAIVKQASSPSPNSLALTNSVGDELKIGSRAAVRKNKDAARVAKKRSAFISSCVRIVDEIEAVLKVIQDELDSKELTSISFLFGATPLSPREIYTVKIPFSSSSCASNSRLGVHLFRSMVSNEKFQQLSSTKLPVSNLFILFCKSSVPDFSCLRYMPDYSLPPISRCPRVNISIIPSIETEVPPLPASRRLRFNSGLVHDMNKEEHNQDGFNSPEDCGASADTPEYGFNDVANNDKMMKSEDIVKTCRKVQHMDLCTPLVTRFSGPTNDFTTPGVFTSTSRKKYTQIMEKITPAFNAKLRLSDPMDLCTPVINMSRLFQATPAPLVCCGESMELCTPSIGDKDSKSCSPCTTVENSNSDLTIKLGNSNLSKSLMKDSGIFSPGTSRAESEYWFVTASPIRGFK